MSELAVSLVAFAASEGLSFVKGRLARWASWTVAAACAVVLVMGWPKR